MLVGVFFSGVRSVVTMLVVLMRFLVFAKEVCPDTGEGFFEPLVNGVKEANYRILGL